MQSKIESLLFIASKPLTLKQLAELLKKEKDEVEKELNKMIAVYEEEKRGVQIIKNEGKYQMVSSPDNAKVVQDFIKDETTGELTRPSLETLTIIAYREPISKLDLERIRGVNCSLILRNLMLRGLVEENFDKQKNENYYSVTLDFIRFLGINSVSELPDYEKLSQDDSIEKILEQHKQEPEKQEVKE